MEPLAAGQMGEGGVDGVGVIVVTLPDAVAVLLALVTVLDVPLCREMK